MMQSAYGLMLVLSFVARAHGISFRVEPSPQTIVLGQTMTVRCQVDNQDNINVYWQNVGTGEYLSRDRKIDPFDRLSKSVKRRYRIVGDSGSGEYNLMIRRVSMVDGSEYRCLYFTDTAHFSQVAHIRVLKPPDKGFPSCLLGPGLHMDVGDNITLICESMGGDPPATLTWIRGKEILDSTFIPHATRRVAGYEHTLTEADRNVRFTCVARNQALAQPRSCYVIPLRSRIEVILRPVVTTIYLGDSISFNCISENVPHLQYHWTVNGNPITESTPKYILLKSNMRLRVVNATLEDDASVVICRVQQDELGLGDHAEGHLYIRKVEDNVFTNAMLTTVPLTTTPMMTTPEVKLTTNPITTTTPVTTAQPVTTTEQITTTLGTTTAPPSTTIPVTTQMITTTKPITTTEPVTTSQPFTTTKPITTTQQITTTEPVTTTQPITTTESLTTPKLTTTKRVTTTKPATTETQTTSEGYTPTTPKPPPPPSTNQPNVIIGENELVPTKIPTEPQPENVIPGMPGTEKPTVVDDWDNNLSGLLERAIARPNSKGKPAIPSLQPPPQRGDIPQFPITRRPPTTTAAITTMKTDKTPVTEAVTQASWKENAILQDTPTPPRPHTERPTNKPTKAPTTPTTQPAPTTTIQATTVQSATNSSVKPTLIKARPPQTKVVESSNAGVAAGLSVTFILLAIVGVGLAVYFFKFRKAPSPPPPQK